MAEMLSIADAAALLGVSKSTAHRYIKKGLLRAQMVSSTWIVFADSVAECRESLKPGADGLYTAGQAAVELGLSEPLVHHHLKSGRLKGERTPDGWRITKEEIERFAAEPRKMGRPKGSGRKGGRPDGAEPAGGTMDE